MKQNTMSQRIVAEIRSRIRSGKLGPGEHVPSAREIVREWNVAIATATKVLAALKREGLVRVRPGIGTIVRGERGVELSRERITQTAIAIADDEGTGTLTMRTLARELGVATMSLYRHVRSREELVILMADAVLAEDPPPARGRKPWRTQLEIVAHLQWAGYRRHPWLAHTVSVTRPQLLKNGMRHTESILEALSELGLDGPAVLRTGVALIAYVRGMAASLEAEVQAEQDTGMNSEEWMASQQATFAPFVAQLPTLARLSEGPDVDMSIDVLFECGLACFLDGLEARAGRPTRAQPG
ncbi:MAG TPA: TetR/AcrR family transcriptional regulator C-terminal domain-containing protein [Polyangiaceae bacterium]|nr:TetR/AcrR family transcriptional regulator C-terminal domain-containing protein [Polyangiaceae bacterium]